MRVLLTTDTVGGVWTFTRELTGQLINQGHSVALVSFGRTPSPTQIAWAEGMIATHSDEFVFHACDAPLEWMQDNHLVWAAGAELLMGVAEMFQADILHSNQFCWGALPLRLPKLITAHSDVRSWAAACRSEGLASSPWLDRYHSLVQNGVDGADAIVSPTAWMHDALSTYYEVVAPSHVIPNGRALPDLAAERKRELRAVSVGRIWDEGKGLSMLGEVVSPMPLAIAGEHSFEDGSSQNLPSHITALGSLDEKSLYDLFFTSSVYLATSIYEPFGLAPLEAGLCGCAIVARDLPSLREVWGDAALYFKDSIGLQAVLTELAGDPGRLQQVRLAATERARSFRAERMADQYAVLYRQLLSAASGASSGVEEELHAA